WLGVNECGLLVAITNRSDRPTPAKARSRGLLVRDLLNTSCGAEAVEVATDELTSGDYAGCNIVVLDAKSSQPPHAGNSIRGEIIRSGIHALTSADIDDSSDPRISYAFERLSKFDLSSASGTAKRLRAICSDNTPDRPPMCLHGPQGGTVSSSVIVLRIP